MKSNAWLPVGALMTVVVLLFGGFLVWRVMGFPDINRQTEKVTYDHAASRIVFSDMASDDITVHGRANAGGVSVERRLEWTKTKPVYHETWNGDVLTVSVDCPHSWMGDCGVDYIVDVPASVAVEVHVSSGDVELDGLTAPAVVTASSGDVRVRGLSADSLDVRSTSGDLVFDGLAVKTLKAGATSGDIHATFTSAPTTVDAAASSGDVTVTMPHSDMTYKVHIETTSGDRSSDVANNDAGTGSIAIRATSGDVKVRLT
jgi:hypothetical protein